MPVQSKFPLLALPYLAGKAVVEQMELQQQFNMSQFRKSRQLLQLIPSGCFKKLSSVREYSSDMIRVSENNGLTETSIAFDSVKTMFKHQISAQSLVWIITKNNLEVFWKILEAHDETLDTLWIGGEIDQDIFDRLVETPQWGQLKKVKEPKRNYHRHDFTVFPEDIAHLDEFYMRIADLSMEAYKEIIWNAEEAKSNFKIEFRRDLCVDGIRDFFDEMAGTAMNIDRLPNHLFKWQPIENDAKNIWVFGLMEWELGAKKVKKGFSHYLFRDFWQNSFIDRY